MSKIFVSCEIAILSFILHADEIIQYAISHRNTISNEVDKWSVFVALSYHYIAPTMSLHF